MSAYSLPERRIDDLLGSFLQHQLEGLTRTMTVRLVIFDLGT